MSGKREPRVEKFYNGVLGCNGWDAACWCGWRSQWFHYRKHAERVLAFHLSDKHGIDPLTAEAVGP